MLSVMKYRKVNQELSNNKKSYKTTRIKLLISQGNVTVI